MNWNHVRLVFDREVRDQMRDRRTLFMIFVLPLLLYPLIGLSFLRVVQFLKDEPNRILIIGREALPESPPLVVDGGFAPKLFHEQAVAKELRVLLPGGGTVTDKERNAAIAQARRQLQQGDIEAALVIPADFKMELDRFRQELTQRASQEEGETPRLPRPRLLYNEAKEKSRYSEIRVQQVLARWTDAIGRENLAVAGLPASTAAPFEVVSDSVASPGKRDAALWSKSLPFILLIWALTGAFYPAVDLCAGEKERGTLETLLICPAERSEIVWGKLLTVMLFSMATALLNLMSVGLTGGFVISQIPNLGPPPWTAMVWLVVALPPVAALFSALCLALAALARSTKEGQYYLMPLVLVITPLVFASMWPGVELSLGFSLIPVTGIVLLLRTLLEGEFWTALRFAPPVIVVTAICCHMAIRWAVDQFSRENVLFRESERLDLKLWLKHLWRDRQPTPTFGAAISCALSILLLQFFFNAVGGRWGAHLSFTSLMLLSQAIILAPALGFAYCLTRSRSQTLQLALPDARAFPIAVLMAVCLHPAVMAAQVFVTRLYPISAELAESLGTLQKQVASTPTWQILLLMAVIPAVCEELAFRGFILSGLRRLGNWRQAVIISAVFFGVAHPLQQQSILACLAGLVLGYLAVHSASIWPPMLFHVTHNSLGLLYDRFGKDMANQSPGLAWLWHREGDSWEYNSPIVLAGILGAGLLASWLTRREAIFTPEERLYEALRHDASSAPVG